MPSRRAVLATTAGLVPTLAGCASVLSDDSPSHFVDVLNGATEPHTFAVVAIADDGSVLFDHTYDLGPSEGDENRTIDGTPARVEVAVDGGDPVVIPWEPQDHSSFVTNNPDGCAGGTTTSLTVWYGRAGDASLEPSFECETVR